MTEGSASRAITPREIAAIDRTRLWHGDVVHYAAPNTGADLFAAANPNAEPVFCCMGEINGGIEACTCWTPVYDTDQSRPKALRVDELEVRSERCGDCAFRKGSPELSDEWTREELLALPHRGVPFWCHDGMRRPTKWVHPERGEIPGAPDDWHPVTSGAAAWRADGRPAILCAGWASAVARSRRPTT